MYPDFLMKEKIKNYWHEDEFFRKHPFHWAEIQYKTAYQIGMHSHQFLEINIVTGGSGCHYIEQRKIPVKRGDVFVIPADVHHGYFCGFQLAVNHILIKKQFFMQYRQELNQLPGYQALFEIEPHLRRLSTEKFYLHLSHEELNDLQKEFEKMYQAGEEGLYAYRNIVLLNLISNLCLKMNRQYNALRQKQNYNLLDIIEYIQNNLEQKMTIEGLAGMVAMSRSTFNRQFRKMFQISPNEYIINCRTSKAIALIGEQSLSKSEIAQICGFYDTSHMDKYLKRFQQNQSCHNSISSDW